MADAAGSELRTEPSLDAAVTHAVTATAPRLHEHLVPLAGDDWALWRTAAVRGAGFPASQVRVLEASRVAELADSVLDLERGVNEARGDALALLTRQPGSGTDRERQQALRRARRRVKKGLGATAGEEDTPWAAAAIATLHASQHRLEAAHLEFREQFHRGVAKVSSALCGLGATDERFREALLWQNRRAVATAIAPLVRRRVTGARRTAKQRHYEELVASYLLRYCLKNETIGFFGPVGWATLGTAGSPLVLRPGRRLLAERRVNFEVWCIDALADALARDGTLDLWLAPARMPNVYLDGATLLTPDDERIELCEADAAVLESSDGQRTVRQIARRVLSRGIAGVHSEQDVLTKVRELRQRGWVSLSLAAPMTLDPERHLRRLLSRIDDDDRRTAAMAALTDLEHARDRVALAAGNPAELDRSLGELDEVFTRVTGRAAVRSGGQTYAARTLVHEDCRRDLDVTIGREVVDALGPPLSLVLASARWLTCDIASRYLSAFLAAYHGLTSGTSSPVSLDAFLRRTYPLWAGERARAGADAQAALWERWARVLNLEHHSRAADFRCDDLQARVDAAFAAPGPGWPYARYHSPDVMIAARSAEHIRRGDFRLVLGEVHAACNTLGWWVFLAQHPRRGELFEAMSLDIPEARLEPVLPKVMWPGQTARVLPALFSPRDLRLRVSPDPCDADPSRVLPVAAFVVSEEAGALVARSRDGTQCFDVVSVMAQVLTWQVMGRLSVLPPAPHNPRVSFDRLVVSRESWTFDAAALEFAAERDEASRFLSARRWARGHGFPRFVFVRTALEKKPFCVDWDSPVAVNILAKRTRLTAAAGACITVTEMLPHPDQAWLIDREGNRYTCELRLVAVDRSGGSRNRRGAKLPPNSPADRTLARG